MCAFGRAPAPESGARAAPQQWSSRKLALKEICRVDEVSEDEPFQAAIEGHEPFGVFMANGEIFVMHDKCNHSGASLSLEGRVENGHVVCGWHDATFDLRTGAAVSGPCAGPMRIYPATIEGGRVLVDL